MPKLSAKASPRARASGASELDSVMQSMSARRPAPAAPAAPATPAAPAPAMPSMPATAAGGMPGMKKGGSIDGIARRGKTRGTMVTMKKGGRCR